MDGPTPDTRSRILAAAATLRFHDPDLMRSVGDAATTKADLAPITALLLRGLGAS